MTVDHKPSQGFATPLGYHTPGSADTQVTSSVSRCTSFNYIKDNQQISVNPNKFRNVSSMMPLSEKGDCEQSSLNHHQVQHSHPVHQRSSGSSTLPRAEGPGSRISAGGGRLQGRSLSTDSVYTILIKLPHEPSPDCSLATPTILMIEEETTASSGPNDSSYPASGIRSYFRNTSPLVRRGDSVCSDPSGSASLHRHNECSLHPKGPHASPASAKRNHHIGSDLKLPLNAKIIPKQLAKNSGSTGTNMGTANRNKKKKKKHTEKKQDRKAAKTLSAILLAFIITWTPYNVMVLIKPILSCEDCIPPILWNFGYYLCYVNSTINPMLYALCNASFRRTYVRILTCKWHSRRRHGVNRGFYC